MSKVELTALERKIFECPESWNLTPTDGAALAGVPIGSFSASRFRMVSKGVWRRVNGVYELVPGVALGDTPRAGRVKLVHLTATERLLVEKVDQWSKMSNQEAVELLQLPIGTFTSVRCRLVGKGVLLRDRERHYSLAKGTLDGDSFKLHGYVPNASSRRVDVDELNEIIARSSESTPTAPPSRPVPPRTHHSAARIIGALGVDSLDEAADVVVGLCNSNLVMKRVDLLRQLSALDR